MKKILLVYLVVCFISICLCGCGDENNTGNSVNNTENSETLDYISLDTSNCYYYLSIDDSLVSSERWNSSLVSSVSNYKVVISGAVSGLFSDCVLTFEYKSNGNVKQETVQLNAAGFASFSYGIVNAGYRAKVVSCEGKIYL